MNFLCVRAYRESKRHPSYTRSMVDISKRPTTIFNRFANSLSKLFRKTASDSKSVIAIFNLSSCYPKIDIDKSALDKTRKTKS